jgi:hypothetical protein
VNTLGSKSMTKNCLDKRAQFILSDCISFTLVKKLASITMISSQTVM